MTIIFPCVFGIVAESHAKITRMNSRAMSERIARIVHIYKNLMTPSKRWSSLALCSIIYWLSLVACGPGVLLTREGINGGVVRYFYNEHKGPMVSPNRDEAFTQIRRYCAGAYTIIKEGPTRGRRRVAEGIGTSDVITEPWWGIRFRCKEPGNE